MEVRATQSPTVRRLAIAVRGVVQGVGFRPFVYNAARAGRLSGWVLNEADTVLIEVQGDRHALDAFVEAIKNRHPPQARIDTIDIEETAPRDDQPAKFDIRTAAGHAAPGPVIPADMATCHECLAEIRDPGERRYGYPFTNCTNCGPRWSIIEALPYDRPRTSMAGFEMCPDCRAEYENPADRRFHAQPIACPRCGPTLRLLDARGRQTYPKSQALAAAVECLLAGQIVALKGLGGFQLLVDATSEEAVALLRKRKHRPDKPLAVMIRSLAEVRQSCNVSADEAEALSSYQAPILLLQRRNGSAASVQDSDSEVHSLAAGHRPALAPKKLAPKKPVYSCPADITDGVAPGNPYLGVMLPYTPLHHLLLDALGRPIVCTSGNLSEEPMAITTEDALERLGAIADVFLTHNRPIVRPVDDSVAQLGPDGLQVLRRARGFAPLPIRIHPTAEPRVRGQRSAGRDQGSGVRGQGSALEAPIPDSRFPIPDPRSPIPDPQILAVGGHLKNTVALCLGSQVVLSPHVGDLDNVLSVQVHHSTIEDLMDFFRARPEAVACDLHPDYASTRHAEALAAQWNVPLVRVQHHYAHVAACMAEHHLKGPVLGFSWDGTGYGSDGTVWGGEALLCEGAHFRRISHLRTFALPGADKAVRQPRRSALGVLFEIFAEEAVRYVHDWFGAGELKTLISMLSRAVRAPRTSSMGRLFDAVAALCGLPRVISFEGEAAMALEFAADVSETCAYPLPVSGDTPAVADWGPTIRAVLADLAAGESIGAVSGRFHNALAEMAVATARAAGCRQIALVGGCFQNAILTKRVRRRLLEEGFSVYTHQKVPPGDGGIALGQAFVAARQFVG